MVSVKTKKRIAATVVLVIIQQQFRKWINKS